MQRMNLILKKIQDAMIRLELILLDIKTQLARKTNVGHGHDISNTTGLEYALDGKASKIHQHTYSDIQNLEERIRSLTEPKFFMQNETADTRAIIYVKLLSTQGYCMDHITLQLTYREVFTAEWKLIDRLDFMYGQPVQRAIENLKPNTAYHVRLTIGDKYSPLMKSEVVDMIKTTGE